MKKSGVTRGSETARKITLSNDAPVRKTAVKERNLPQVQKAQREEESQTSPHFHFERLLQNLLGQVTYTRSIRLDV